MTHHIQPTLKRDPSTGGYSGPGLIDLQVNGVDGIDFNDLSLTKEDVLQATEYLLGRGVTAYFPTIITNSDEAICSLFKTLSDACTAYPLVEETVAGFHLEGPFLSPKDGAKGAHDAQFIKPPDWKSFEKFQEAAGGNIRLVTLAPEWEGSVEFIEKCWENGILISMGHSLADTDSIKNAVDAGMLLSTHLGNGIPLMLKRHPNLLWDQLAEDDLTAMIIADGHHIPDSFIKVVMKSKGENVILVSDMTRFAGMAPGEYETFIGGNVVLDDEKRLSVKGGGGILAGAAKDLLECVETVINHQLASVEVAWEMASTRVRNILADKLPGTGNNNEDEVEFIKVNNNIRINRVIKGNKIVFQAKRS